MNVRFFEMHAPEGKQTPRWKRTFGIRDDGQVLIPAAVAGDEQEVMLCATYSGMSVATAHKHLYVPSTWVETEFPPAAEVAKVMREKVLEMHRNGELD